MDGNIVIITGGTGIGQIRKVSITQNNRLWFWNNWETVPANGDTFIVCWSPADVVYANATAGTNTFKDKDRQLAFVEITDNLRIGDGTTETWWGMAGYSFAITNENLEGTGWTTCHRRYANSNCYYGEWNPIAKTFYSTIFLLTANLQSFRTKCYDTLCWEEWQSTTPDLYIYGSDAKTGTWAQDFGNKPTEVAISRFTGSDLSYHNLLISPESWNSMGDWTTYAGGWDIIYFNSNITFNVLVRNWRAEWIGSSLGMFGLGNIGNIGADLTNKFVKWIDCNWDLDMPVAQGGHGRTDWTWDKVSNGGSLFYSKSLNLKVIDEAGNAIQGVIVEIKDRMGNLITYEDSGSNINEYVDKTETSINVTNRENLSNDDLIRVDQEYMTITSVSGSGNGIMVVTRESRYSDGYPALIHENNANSWDPNIYIIKLLTTDANGKIPEQIIDIGYWTSNASQVKVDGVYYTCNNPHQADGTNKPPNASYWDVGGNLDFEWISERYYAPTGAGTWKRDLNRFNPFTITVEKVGFQPYSQQFDISLDSEGEDITIMLKRIKMNVDLEVLV